MNTINILNEGLKERYLKDINNTSVKNKSKNYVESFKKTRSAKQLKEFVEDNKQQEIDLENRIIDHFNKNQFNAYDELYAYRLPSGNFNLSFDINWGDWKHEHLRADYLVKEFINENEDLTLVDIWDEPGPDTGEDVYDAKHVYIISQKLAESFLKENLSYFNNIDQDLINVARDKEIPAALTTANMIKCSKSAINNVKYLLSKGKQCKLCLGSFVDKDGNTTKEVSHVWVEDANKNIYQTHVPSGVKSVKRFKSIILNPNDLDRLEKKITKFVKY